MVDATNRLMLLASAALASGLTLGSAFAQAALTPEEARTSVNFQTIAPSHDFKFAANRVLDRNNRPRLEFESREHGTELVHGDRIVAIRQHIAAPVIIAGLDVSFQEVVHSVPTGKAEGVEASAIRRTQ